MDHYLYIGDVRLRCRYIGVCHPLRRRDICTTSSTRRLVLGLILVSFTLNIFKPLLSQVSVSFLINIFKPLLSQVTCYS